MNEEQGRAFPDLLAEAVRNTQPQPIHDAQPAPSAATHDLRKRAVKIKRFAATCVHTLLGRQVWGRVRL